MDFHNGDMLDGKYVIKRFLNRGTFASVYLGEHLHLGREVALKLFPDIEDVAEYEHIAREGRIMASIHHKNIVGVLDSGFDQAKNCAYIAMEYVQGATLADYINTSTALSLEQIFFVISEAACALEEFAGKGIVHRDIKPGNILISKQGEVKISDFGIARAPQTLSEEAATNTINITNIMLGTPEYASPEQIYNGHDVDVRSDIYSLGICFYFLLTHQSPFAGKTAVETINNVINKSVVPPIRLNPSIPYLVNDLVLRMIHKNRDMRPQTPAQLLSEMTSVLAILREKNQGGLLCGPEVKNSTPLADTEKLDRPSQKITPSLPDNLALSSSLQEEDNKEKSRKSRKKFGNVKNVADRIANFIGLPLLLGILVFPAGIFVWDKWEEMIKKNEQLKQEKQAQAKEKRLAQEKAREKRLAQEKARQEKAREKRLALEKARQEKEREKRLALEKAREEKARKERLALEKARQERTAAKMSLQKLAVRRKSWTKAPKGWFNNYEEALALAGKSGKKLFVLFTGSDWCGPCRALKKNVLDKKEFMDFASERFHLVYIDTMARTFQKPSQKEYNRALRNALTRSRSGGVPTVVILDPEERILGSISGYSSRMDYFDRIEKVLNKKDQSPEKVRPLKLFRGSGFTLSNEEFEIEDGILALCKNKDARKIVIPEGVVKIASGAFQNFRNLEEIILPETLTQIDSGVFINLPLAALHLPSSLRSLHNFNFFRMPYVRITVDKKNPLFSADETGLYLHKRVLLKPFTARGQKKYTVKEGTHFIAGWAFAYHPELEHIVVSDSVRNLTGYMTFSGCPKLKKVELPSSLISISGYVFANSPSLTDVNLPESLRSIGFRAFQNCRKLKLTSPPAPSVKIGRDAFKGTAYEKIENERQKKQQTLSPFSTRAPRKALNIDNEVCLIVNSVFKKFRHTRNTDVYYMPEGVTRIAPKAFGYASRVGKVILPEGVERMDAQAFFNCSNIKEVVIPASLKRILPGAFMGSRIRKMTVKAGNPFYSFSAAGLYYSPAGTSGKRTLFYAVVPPSGVLEIPEGVVTAESYCCNGNDSLKKVIFPSSLRRVRAFAFQKNSKLREVKFANGIKVIDVFAFFQCPLLKYINLPATLQEIRRGAFYGCRRMELDPVPDPKKTKIDKIAFKGTKYEGWF